uniref:NGR2 n=1 Tax=Oryza punctata TaxID=4537 RepID=A0A0E0KEW6_ORYPU
MGIVSWVQGRLGGRTATAAESRVLAAGNPSAVAAVVAAGKERNHQQQVVPDDLAGDHDQQWPPPSAHLFSIGTLGNDDLPEQDQEEDLPEFSVEEVRKLQDALARLLLRARSKKYSEAIAAAASTAAGGADSGLPLDRFLNCPSSLEVDRRAQRDHGGGGAAAVGLSPDTKMILTKAKDILVDGNSRNTTTSDIKNKSFKFLLKKMFVCHGGFAPAPSLKDPTESSMEKVSFAQQKCNRFIGLTKAMSLNILSTLFHGRQFLRTVLGKKKISARSSNSPASRTYFLEGNNAHGDDHRLRRHRRRGGGGEEEEEENKGEESCKWDRTDSECE